MLAVKADVWWKLNFFKYHSTSATTVAKLLQHVGFSKVEPKSSTRALYI